MKTIFTCSDVSEMRKLINSRGFVSIDEWDLFSDMYKDEFGFRPRTYDFEDVCFFDEGLSKFVGNLSNIQITITVLENTDHQKGFIVKVYNPLAEQYRVFVNLSSDKFNTFHEVESVSAALSFLDSCFGNKFHIISEKGEINKDVQFDSYKDVAKEAVEMLMHLSASGVPLNDYIESGAEITDKLYDFIISHEE